MAIEKFIRNLKTNGLKETLKKTRKRLSAMLFKKRARIRELEKQVETQNKLNEMFGEFILFKEMKANDADPEALEEVRSRIQTLENGAVRRALKELYVKKIIPEIYAEESKKPVTDTVIFMESGTSPSPSSFHIAKELEKQGKYEVKYIGLKIRKVPEIEFYDNACDFIRQAATAKAVFLSTANNLMSQFDVRPETKVIQLWHGVGVFKKVGYSTADNDNFGLSQKDRDEYDQYRNYSYVTLPAEEQAWIFEDAMHISRDSGVLVPVGVARTDVFYDQAYIAESYNKLYTAFPQIRGKKLILYAPTFRGKVRSAQAPDKLDVRAFAEKLSDEYVLLIKHHGLSKNVPPIPEDLENTFAFDMGANKVLGIERLLSIADICITDYSSIAFEFAIMERPILFFAYDLEDYIDKRGMYYDYEDITPGPVCKTNEEMIDYIEHVDERFDKQVITDFKNKYVNMCDGHATERTIALIEN